MPATPAPFFNDFSRHPPTEKFMTVDGLLRSHAAERGQTPLICFPYQSVSDFEEHAAKDIERYTNLAVHFYMQNGLKPAVGAHAPLLCGNESLLIFCHRTLQQTKHQ